VPKEQHGLVSLRPRRREQNRERKRAPGSGAGSASGPREAGQDVCRRGWQPHATSAKAGLGDARYRKKAPHGGRGIALDSGSIGARLAGRLRLPCGAAGAAASRGRALAGARGSVWRSLALAADLAGREAWSARRRHGQSENSLFPLDPGRCATHSSNRRESGSAAERGCRLASSPVPSALPAHAFASGVLGSVIMPVSFHHL